MKSRTSLLAAALLLALPAASCAKYEGGDATAAAESAGAPSKPEGKEGSKDDWLGEADDDYSGERATNSWQDNDSDDKPATVTDKGDYGGEGAGSSFAFESAHDEDSPDEARAEEPAEREAPVEEDEVSRRRTRLGWAPGSPPPPPMADPEPTPTPRPAATKLAVSPAVVAGQPNFATNLPARSPAPGLAGAAAGVMPTDPASSLPPGSYTLSTNEKDRVADNKNVNGRFWKATGGDDSGDNGQPGGPDKGEDGRWRSTVDGTEDSERSTTKNQDRGKSSGAKAAGKRGFGEQLLLDGQIAGRDADGEMDLTIAGLIENTKEVTLERRGRHSKRAATTTTPALLAQLQSQRRVKPPKMLGRKLYFENTYLGGNAGHAARVARLAESLGHDAPAAPHMFAETYAQPFDPPAASGLGLDVSLDRGHLDEPGRVLLQVGLQGSAQYGWRRPPLDLVLVLDGPVVAAGPQAATSLIATLLDKLGPLDRLGVVTAGQQPEVVITSDRPRGVRQQLSRLDLRGPQGWGPGALVAAMHEAASLLRHSDDADALAGTRTLLLATAGPRLDEAEGARRLAHSLTLEGMVTSVLQLDEGVHASWYAVCNAGYGNYHQVSGGDVEGAITAELAALARVVARLVRVNIRLGKHTGAVRILGSRVLDAEEAARVKAREVATDRQLARTMGVTSDRGEDDDGLQTVIPYFLGGDSHVLLVELWVDKPGVVADVTVKYKDMVRLDNATAQASVTLGASPREPRPWEAAVTRNARGFLLGEALQRAGHRIRHGDQAGAQRELAMAAELAASGSSARDRAMIANYQRLVGASDLRDARRRRALTDSLVLAGESKVGQPPLQTARR